MHEYNSSGFTPILLAFSIFRFGEEVEEELQIIKLLLEHGANPDDQERVNGDTPFHLSVRNYKNAVALELLCRHSTNRATANHARQRPLDLLLESQANHPNDKWYDFAEKCLNGILKPEDYRPPDLVAWLADEIDTRPAIPLNL